MCAVLCDNTDKFAVVRRPANPAKGLIANVNFIRPFNFAANDWDTFTFRLTQKSLELSVNKVPVFRDASKYILSRPQTIQIKSGEEALEIRSFTVQPILP